MTRRFYSRNKKPIKIPHAPSALEETFVLHLMSARLPDMPEREYKFHPERNWRFDFAWPAYHVAVECEGGVYSGGRHVRPQGFIDDCEKYNAAALAGWKVLRFTAQQINSLEAIRLTREALKL